MKFIEFLLFLGLIYLFFGSRVNQLGRAIAASIKAFKKELSPDHHRIERDVTHSLNDQEPNDHTSRWR